MTTLTGNIDNSKKLTNDILRELIRFYQIGEFTMPKTEIVIIHSVVEKLIPLGLSVYGEVNSHISMGIQSK